MIIACDFDGTIVTHEYPKIGKPIPFAIQTLKKLQEEDHHQIILWTVREGELLQEALDYCKSRGLDRSTVQPVNWWRTFGLMTVIWEDCLTGGSSIT